MFFKTKLMSFVEYIPAVSSRDHRNNYIESAVRAINISHGLSEQDTDLNASIKQTKFEHSDEATTKEKNNSPSCLHRR
jgi:hypothetical protein